VPVGGGGGGGGVFGIPEGAGSAPSPFEFEFDDEPREGAIPAFDPQAFRNPVATPGEVLFGDGSSGGDDEIDPTGGLF
jgi:hypothetical protein